MATGHLRRRISAPQDATPQDAEWAVLQDTALEQMRMTPELREQRINANLRRMDKDRDGVVSRDEFMDAGGKGSDFDQLDRNQSGTLTRDLLDFDTAVVPRNYFVRGFSQAGLQGAVVDERLELDYRRKSFQNNLTQQLNLFFLVRRIAALSMVVVVAVQLYNAYLPLFVYSNHEETASRNSVPVWTETSADCQVICLCCVMGICSHFAAWFLDTHEELYLQWCCSSLSRSNIMQFCQAAVYGILVACIFRNMLFATYNMLILVEREDVMRTYGNAFWLIALANLHSLERVVCHGGLVYVPAAVLCCVIALGLITACRTLEDGELEGNDIVFVMANVASFVHVLEGIRTRDATSRQEYLLHGAGSRYLRQYFVKGPKKRSILSGWTICVKGTYLLAVGSRRHVVVKTTTDELLFEREMSIRQQHQFDKKFVLQVLRTHTPKDQFVLVLPRCATSITTAVTDDGYKDNLHPLGWNILYYVLLKSFQEETLCPLALSVRYVVAYRFAGVDLEKITSTARQTAEAIQHVHAHGLVHCRLGPRKVRFHRGSNRWLLVDMSGATLIGKPLQCSAITEACAPPELLAHLKDGAKADEPVTASVAIDIWGFGPLHSYASSTEKLQQYDHDSLSVWKEPCTSKLQMVLAEAGVSPIRRILAMDLVCCCLEGTREDRIGSMEQVLNHPFFVPQDPVLPLLSCPRISKLDVIFSYQSTQEALLRRLRRALNHLGFTTFDGTQVPGGRDWRITYFQKLEKALCFVPIVSPNFLQSQACYDESRVANARDIPVVQVLLQPVGCAALFHSKKSDSVVARFTRAKTQGHLEPESPGYDSLGQRLDDFSEWGYGQAANNCAATIPTTDRSFEEDFFPNFALLANAIESSLTYDASLHAVIAYAEPDKEFARALALKLGKHFNVACINGRESDGGVGHDWAERLGVGSVLIPVLSGKFLKAHPMAKVMQTADSKHMSFCPVLYDWKRFNATLSKIGKYALNMPYILSIRMMP